MSEKKDKVFAVSIQEDGERIGVSVSDNSLTLAERYVVFLHFLRNMIESKDLPEDRRQVLRNFYGMLVNPADNASVRSPSGFPRVVTIYKLHNGKYLAVEFRTSPVEGPTRSGWAFVDTYDKVVDRINKDFGYLRRLRRDATDAPDVLENWV